MIQAQNIRKRFGSVEALAGLSLSIPEGSIYGLVGSNGAGKSTLLRILAGVYRPDAGTVTIDEKAVWENPEAKSLIAYVSDEVYAPPGVSMNRMAELQEAVFERFDRERFTQLSKLFELDTNRSLGTFSKGMKRQAAIALALARRPKYLLLDEAFDGLDPVMRRMVRGLIADELLENKMTAVITSHSLRELEDTCDTLALLHRGGLILESDIGTLKTNLFKVQVAFEEPFDETRFKSLEIMSYKKTGSVATLIVRGDSDEAVQILRAQDPVLLDILPLTLEEVFDYEMEALGYSFAPESLSFIRSDEAKTRTSDSK